MHPLGCCCSKPCLAHSPCVQAFEKSQVLQDILEASNTTPEYLWRRAKKADPNLQFRFTTVKPAFTEEEKLQRINFCLAMLSEPPEWLHGIVWLDESSVPFTVRPIRVIGRRGTEALQTDPRIPRDKRKIPYLHYMLSVCWATGLVRMDILSFSAGAHDPVQYYVSVGCRCAAACTPTSSLGHLVFLCVAARVEPQLLPRGPGSKLHCLVNCTRPVCTVQVVQAQQAAACLPCRLVLAPVRCLLCFWCVVMILLAEMLWPIHFHLQPPLLLYAARAAQHTAEVKPTIFFFSTFASVITSCTLG